jgi:predicted acetyltransferase
VPVPELVRPTLAVRDSYLAGERDMAADEGESPSWLPQSPAEFVSFVAQRGVTRVLWEVPTTEFWFIDGKQYLGTVMIRHDLTPQLRREGGHIGYHVVPAHRRRGHATAMLAGACDYCRDCGMTEVLLTCTDTNTGSRRVIEANGGVLTDIVAGTCLYWIKL